MKQTICGAAMAVLAAGGGAQAAGGAAAIGKLGGPPEYVRLADASAAAGGRSALGASGSAGTQAPDGRPGSLPPVVVADHWVPYRSFRFDDGRAVIRAVDERQVIDTAAYLTENPSLRFGIDDSVDPAVTNAGDRDLGKRRVAAVRDALIEAGTPAYRIEMGAFADPQNRRYRQVELFLITVR